MIYVWRITYYIEGLFNELSAIAFSKEGAGSLDTALRDRKYRVDPKPKKVPISELTLQELEDSLRIIGEEVIRWDKFKADMPMTNWKKEIDELRELGNALFIEHDMRLGKCESSGKDLLN
jgi:hypothetical protein